MKPSEGHLRGDCRGGLPAAHTLALSLSPGSYAEPSHARPLALPALSPAPATLGPVSDARSTDHIVVENLSKRFGSRQVLSDISFTAPRGETTVILGGSGTGKTTLLRLIVALLKPTTGHIYIDGEDIVPMNEVELNRIRRKFGMVFQYAALLDSLDVLDNVAFPLREHTKLKENEIRDKVREILEILGLEGTEKLFPAELSGGMRKRVGLARALMLEPEILVYDEPTSGLDPETARIVDDLIEETRQRFSVTSLVISHDIASTFRIAHQLLLLEKGRIVAHGSPDELAEGPLDSPARKFIEASSVAIERVPRPTTSLGLVKDKLAEGG